jgi:Ca2+-transporting ATPase
MKTSNSIAYEQPTEGPAWYRLEADEALARLGSDGQQGLGQAEARRRLAQYGPNELVERGLKSPWRILWEQLTAIMVLILIVVTVISIALGEYKDALAILVIVVLNTVLGFTQEYRAERAIAALKKLAVPQVKARRDGQVREISAREMVPGDIVLLEAGALVPADGRLIEVANLRIQEAALTGESEPVDKGTNPLRGESVPVADQRNMAFMGTAVTYGRGAMAVTASGMDTELGHIAEMLQTVEVEQTPLQRRLEQLGRGLAVAALAIVGLVFALGLLRGEDAKLMFLTAISMAVAAVPEGLPAVVTIGLALGAQRMLKRQALIRRLPAVETLGSVTVICSDKTGTLTENRMTVTVLDIAGRTVDLTVDLEDQPRQEVPVLSPDEPVLKLDHPALTQMLVGGALCNDATIAEGDGPGRFHAVGDPTEGALVVAAARAGLWKGELERALPRVAEIPFTSERKRMTTVHEVDKRKVNKEQLPLSTCLPDYPPICHLAFTKGAVDSLLEVSDRVWVDGQIEPLDEHWRGRIEGANDRLAGDGMRVLGVAFRPLETWSAGMGGEELEHELIFVGLIGMIDPPRPEVKEGIATCKTAGIRPVMITGDHPLTALHIARELGIGDGARRVVTGQELATMSVEDLEAIVEEVAVYARVSPEHKLKIVQALQNRGHVAAMTGDGVNDAPALKKADIGVAMGITGTDVSKEAADMVLLDDNFATIVAAVQEGRTIYSNIRKFIKYTMTSNAGEIWVMLLAPFLGMPLPLLPLQILWVNLLTDGLPGLALTVEPAERDTMRRPPYQPHENIFGRGMGRDILWVGLLMGLICLGIGFWGWSAGRPAWQTMVFTTLTLSQMGNALATRSERNSLLAIGPWSNKALWGAVLLTLILQLAVVYVPFLQGIFGTVALSPAELATSLVLSTIVFWGVEAGKALLRRRLM